MREILKFLVLLLQVLVIGMVGILYLPDDCLQPDYLTPILFHIHLELIIQDVQGHGLLSLLLVIFAAFFQFPIEFAHADSCALYFSLILFVGDDQVIDFILQLSVGHFHNAQSFLQLTRLLDLPVELLIEVVSLGFYSANFDLEIVEIVFPLVNLLVVSP